MFSLYKFCVLSWNCHNISIVIILAVYTSIKKSTKPLILETPIKYRLLMHNAHNVFFRQKEMWFVIRLNKKGKSKKLTQNRDSEKLWMLYLVF